MALTIYCSTENYVCLNLDVTLLKNSWTRLRNGPLGFGIGRLVSRWRVGTNKITSATNGSAHFYRAMVSIFTHRFVVGMLVDVVLV